MLRARCSRTCFLEENQVVELIQHSIPPYTILPLNFCNSGTSAACFTPHKVMSSVTRSLRP